MRHVEASCYEKWKTLRATAAEAPCNSHIDGSIEAWYKAVELRHEAEKELNIIMNLQGALIQYQR
jgi:hypothetical protein